MISASECGSEWSKVQIPPELGGIFFSPDRFLFRELDWDPTAELRPLRGLVFQCVFGIVVVLIISPTPLG